MLYLNIWLICGLISYFRFVYIDKFHEEDFGIPTNRYNKVVVFIILILGGVLSLLFILYYDIQLLWIEIKYYTLSIYDWIKGKLSK